MQSRVYRSKKAAAVGAVSRDCESLALRYSLDCERKVESFLQMRPFNVYAGEIAIGLLLVVALVVVVIWLLVRKRPTAEEMERARRLFLAQSGRLVDGMLLDMCEVDAEDGRTLIMLLFSYRIGGVDYECSQDITNMGEVIDPAVVRAGFPCTVRYQPGNPQNSIVIAEEWTGLRAGIPVLPAFADPDPLDTEHLRTTNHLRPGRG